MNLKPHLYDWVFHFNTYTQKWDATTRDNYNLLFNDRKSGKVLSSSELWTLVEIINRTNGNPDKIEKLTTASENY